MDDTAGLSVLHGIEEASQDDGRIKNPWHSRPLDMHRWSEHKELVGVVDQVWQAHCSELAAPGRSGPKPVQDFRYQLRVLLLDLYVAWLEDPDLCIGVSMSENAWHTKSRYNSLSISKKIIELIYLLHRVGLIVLSKWSYSGPLAPGNRTTRIRAAEPLRAMFLAAKATRDDVYQVIEQECIILKKGEAEDEKSKLLWYEDTDETNRMRTELQAYNLLLADTFIDIPVLEEPWIERDNGRGGKNRVLIDHHHHFVRRIFSRGNWGLNGRFHGPWWQQIGSEWRAKIFINDTPTVEVDYKGLHIQILSAEKGVALKGDPYELPDGLIPGAPAKLQRTVIKKLVLTALNARDLKSACAAFRNEFRTGHMAKEMTNKELEALLTRFIEKHPHLEDCLCTDQGIRLMNVDARIAEIVLRRLTAARIPVLSVHDSFIIDYTQVRRLKLMMGLASRQVTGQRLPVEWKLMGLDETDDPEFALRYEEYRETERSEGYLLRLKNWEERKGRTIIPYRTAYRSSILNT